VYMNGVRTMSHWQYVARSSIRYSEADVLRSLPKKMFNQLAKILKL